MKATSKNQITITALKAHDEIITYSSKCSGHCSSIKMRTIDGKRTFITDTAVPTLNKFQNNRYSTLTKAKANISFCNHF